MNALVLVFTALLVFAIGYRFYGIFLARKVLVLDGARATPAVVLDDGHDYQPTNKYVLFGHHFAAIAAAGPLLGPVLAAQFGYLPGALWILIGAVLAGGVHDMVVLFASVRHKGQSLSSIAEKEVGKVAGAVASFAFFIHPDSDPGGPVDRRGERDVRECVGSVHGTHYGAHRAFDGIVDAQDTSRRH
jgi:carbon starvation protein